MLNEQIFMLMVYVKMAYQIQKILLDLTPIYFYIMIGKTIS